MGVDLDKLSPAALSAAMRGGTAGWGTRGSALQHIRYTELAPKQLRRRCGCGCGQRATHVGMANGVALAHGCELRIARWVKVGTVMTEIQLAALRCEIRWLTSSELAALEYLAQQVQATAEMIGRAVIEREHAAAQHRRRRDPIAVAAGLMGRLLQRDLVIFGDGPRAWAISDKGRVEWAEWCRIQNGSAGTGGVLC